MRNSLALTFYTLAALTCPVTRLSAQASLTVAGSPYTQNFDTLASTGMSSALPAGWQLSETGTSPNVNSSYQAGDGSSNAGDTYSFGSVGSSDRSFGTLLSGTITPTIGACFTNSTGVTLISLAIAYTGEQWRLGTAGRADRLDFGYSVGTSSIATGTYTAFPSLTFSSPTTTGTIGALDGNAAANRAALSATITGLSIANGQNFCIRWVDFNATGADDGLAIDDFSLTPLASVSSNPTSLGSASPNPSLPGTVTMLTATVTPGANPSSTGIAVACDLTSIGGASTFALPNSGANVYSASYTLPIATAAQAFSLPCIVSDSQSRSTTFNIALTVIGPMSLLLSPAALPNGFEGANYTQTLTVANGAGCSFSLTGSPIPGVSLTFSGNGNTAVLSGIPAFSGTFNFTVNATCSNGSVSQSYSPAIAFACETGVKTSTAIHTIQGTGPASPLAGQTVEVEGIVVGDFQSSSQLKGFYLQEPDATWDSDPLTSEGIFIFDNLIGADVNIGDRVRVKGKIDEFSSSGSVLGTTQSSTLTEIGTVQDKLVCSSGNPFTRTAISLPAANLGDLERYEGMAVQIVQPLTVTGNFSLGTFDQIDLAPSVLYTPTSSSDRSTWAARASLNARSVIALDDASSLANANLYPTLFPQGGLSASNTLRVGAIVNYDPTSKTNAPLIGVLDDRFGEYRIQPTAPVTFHNANARPDVLPILANVGGRFRAVSANVLNFFTTLSSRGAQNQTEFEHQKTKVIEELSAMDADIYGLSEVQNFANGNTNGGAYTNVALQSLVDGLNCKKAGGIGTCANPPSTPYSFIDTLGQGSNNGTDAIRSAIIYRADRVTPIGMPALYYQNDTNRPALAQTFQPGSGPKASRQTFTFVVNHLRSKSSACGGASDDPFQGNCNGLRLNFAQNVAAWLAGNPTGDPAGADRKLLLVGDFNAYYGEDPIQYLQANGYRDLIADLIGPGAYSYNFGSEAGYLDHALVNSAFNPLIRSVAEWHINADEPSSLEALSSVNKSAAAQIAYYGADPFAASDHDPIVIGFNPLAGDLNDDGVVDAADQRVIISALGKNATAVDRRIDFDGDGRITLNDYRLWAAAYRAFIQ